MDYNIPYRESKKQGSWPPIHQSSSYLHIQRCTDSASNTNELDMARLQLAVRRVAHRLHGDGDRATAVIIGSVLLRIQRYCFLLVGPRAAIIDSGGGHGAEGCLSRGFRGGGGKRAQWSACDAKYTYVDIYLATSMCMDIRVYV